MAKKKVAKSRKSTLDSITNKRTIKDTVRPAILKRLTQIGETRHWLAQATGMRTATVYDFLTGKRDIRSDKLEKMLGVLGLEIRPKD